LIAPAIFFFIVFSLLAITKMLILESFEVTAISVTTVTVGALIVAKAVLVADMLPLINLFSGSPLILPVLWKTAIYGVLTLVYHCIEELVPLLLKHDGLGTAVDHLISEVVWPQFWALQIWLTVALILYASGKELDTRFGTGSMRKVFFGKPPRQDRSA
ncbi:MAG: hypothetical protein ACLGPL_04270, partial [Acidobacteriota bacterium]